MQFPLANWADTKRQEKALERDCSQPEATVMDACTARTLLPNVWGWCQAPRWCQCCQWGRKETPVHSLHQILHQLHCPCVTTYTCSLIPLLPMHTLNLFSCAQTLPEASLGKKRITQWYLKTAENVQTIVDVLMYLELHWIECAIYMCWCVIR